MTPTVTKREEGRLGEKHWRRLEVRVHEHRWLYGEGWAAVNEHLAVRFS